MTIARGRPGSLMSAYKQHMHDSRLIKTLSVSAANLSLDIGAHKKTRNQTSVKIFHRYRLTFRTTQINSALVFLLLV